MPQVFVKSPAGDVVPMEAEAAAQALSMGYTRVEAPAQPASSVGDTVAAGALGAMRGLTMGLSDLAPLVSGVPFTEGMGPGGNRLGAVTPGEVKALKEQYPITSTVGEVAGVIAPAVLSGGAAGAPTLTGAVSKLGQTVERGVVRAMSAPTIRAVPGVAEEAAKRALSMGLGSTVETAAYSVGQAVSEAALGDPAKVAEHVFADVGLSAMLGLGLGAVGGAVAELTPHAIGAAKNAGAKRLGHWRDYLVEKYPKIAPMLGVDEDIARVTVTNRALLAENKEARNAVVRSLTDAATDVEDVNVAMGRLVHGGPLEEAVKVGAAKINPQAAATETDRLLGLVEGSVGKMGSSPLDFDPGRVRQVAKVLERSRGELLPSVEPVAAKLTDTLRAFREDPNLHMYGPFKGKLVLDDLAEAVKSTRASDVPVIRQTIREEAEKLVAKMPGAKKYADEIASLSDELASSVKGPAEQFATLRKVAKELDDVIPYKKDRLALSPSEKAVVDEALTLRSAIKDSLHDPTRWGDAGSLLARVDAAVGDLIETRKPLLAGSGIFSERMGRGAGPFKTYSVNPDKVGRWMGKIGTEGGEERMRYLADYLDSSKNFVKVYKDVHAAAGMDLPGMDAATITKLIGRTDDAVAKAKTQALLEQAAKAGSQSPDMLGGVAKPALGALGFGPTGFALGTLWSAYGFAKKPTAVASTLYTLEQSAQRVSKAIDTAAKTLMTGSVKAQHVGRGMAAAGLSKVFGEDEERSAKRFEKRLEGVAALVNNPTHLTNTLSAGMSGPMQEHAPKTNEALMNVNLRAVAEIDKVLKPKSRPGFMAGKPVYSQTEINAVNRVFEALDSGPDYLLKQAAAGTLTRAAVDVVRNVLPELYAAQVQNVLKYYVERGGGVDPSRRGMLSILLGQDVDGMLRPVAVAATSASYAAVSEESKPGRKPSNPVTLASRTQTPVGQLAEGEKA